MSTRGRKPVGRVDCTWRAELAYAVGLITADGSLSNNGRHINFTSKDIDLIHTYQRCLGLEDVAIGRKRSGYAKSRMYFQIQFGDVLFYRFLVELGLHANKSRTLKEVRIPDEYFFDFVRGEWDGDGTVYRTQDLRWRSSYVISIGFTSASTAFLEWLQVNINERLATTGFISRVNRGWQLRYAKRDSKKLFAAMFYALTLPHLARKFAKAKEIYRIDGLS